ncbi:MULTISPECIES: ABC transporter ATP-binding protein [Cupriavidus]|uniref:Sugar ABC transporter ATP-binding protein n=2 Tax=Cupriavidus TaxID=106589 RepID=A0A142JMD4_9BURK|nr:MULTISPECIES: ABC transporter ATP-binding protein [Cupriavidus]AMR79246.1 sugar ABC transporter ATP-binding protein [Cupriavidus nantongensis]CAG9186942.1 Vitamin B12 import ATP-binding protein BtuD [Cupriavidus pampae]
MSSEIAIKIDRLAKCYHIYDKPRDRLVQMLSRGKKQFYKEFWALQDVSFEIKKGETVGIVGRNGSGKSTLLQMICGTVTPTSGEVRTSGRVAALLELGAGFNSEFTGRENVMLNASILGFPREEMAARMEQVLAFSELGEFLDQPVKTYSSGMYSRLAFSIAIHVDPDILIVDEALAVGDARFVAKCMRRIKDIQEKGATILFVSHDVGSVRTLCERAIWLDKGRLLEHGDVFPVTGRYMEFMFKDEETADEALRADITSQRDSGALGNTSADIRNAGCAATEAGTQSEMVASPPVVPECVLDARPVTHWGSHKGTIQSASVRDGYGNRKDVLPWGDRLEIVIDLHVPKTISREHLSVAFSIKDLKGTDLIVSTTHDFGGNALPDDEHFSVSFQLTNPLVTGKYLLVAAVENRQHRDIHYYEYVEGAHYFSSLSDQRLFGIFQPAIEQKILVK